MSTHEPPDEGGRSADRPGRGEPSGAPRRGRRIGSISRYDDLLGPLYRRNRSSRRAPDRDGVSGPGRSSDASLARFIAMAAIAAGAALVVLAAIAVATERAASAVLWGLAGAVFLAWGAWRLRDPGA